MNRRYFRATSLLSMAGTRAAGQARHGHWRAGASELPAPAEGSLPSLDGATDWLVGLCAGSTLHPVAMDSDYRMERNAPGSDAGRDCTGRGSGEVREARLYQLIRQTRQVRERLFEIEFLDPGVRTFSFTFG